MSSQTQVFCNEYAKDDGNVVDNGVVQSSLVVSFSVPDVRERIRDEMQDWNTWRQSIMIIALTEMWIPSESVGNHQGGQCLTTWPAH